MAFKDLLAVLAKMEIAGWLGLAAVFFGDVWRCGVLKRNAEKKLPAFLKEH